MLIDPTGGRAQDVVTSVVVWSTAFLVAGIFVWILGDIIRHGIGMMSWSFLTEAPRSAGRNGASVLGHRAGRIANGDALSKEEVRPGRTVVGETRMLDVCVQPATGDLLGSLQ